MDFLDPQKQKAHAVRIAIGYTIIAVALLLGTIVLLYQAYGFGLKNGQIIQNGFVYISSQPSGSAVLVNGKSTDNTRTRLQLPAGGYTVQIRRAGYDTWQRAITVEGGSVERFDYPFLFPNRLNTTITKQYSSAPLLVTQSLDRRWVIVQGGSQDQLDVYDLNQTKPVAKPLTLPTDIFAAGSTTTGWQTIQWSDDNRHALLQRQYQKNGQAGSEFIALDRQDPSQSQNLTVLFGFNPSTIQLKDLNYDQYYVYDQNAQQLFTASLKKPTLVPLLQDVLAFQSNGSDLLYATPDNAPAGQVLIRLMHGSKTYTVHQSPADTSYLLAVSQYAGSPYVAVGSAAEGKVYVYKNPANVLKDADNILVPLQILKVPDANYISFSTNARFVMAENGQQFATYDIYTGKGYGYSLKLPLDAPQTHATWMDGFRMQVISGGKLRVFEFDDANEHTLSATSTSFLPLFTPNYHILYAFNATNALTSTPMLTPADQ